MLKKTLTGHPFKKYSVMHAEEGLWGKKTKIEANFGTVYKISMGYNPRGIFTNKLPSHLFVMVLRRVYFQFQT